jgi:phage repressor protein C with HTH and peptisase S24 domain
MDTFAARFDRALKLRKLGPMDLVNQKVMSRANVYFWLDGTTQPDKIQAATIAKVCKALGVRRDWLLHGKGPIEGPDSTDEDWFDVRGYAQAVGLGKGAEAQEYAETHALKFRASSLQRKRLAPERLAVMYGDGDSMEPRIRKGDAILFDTSDTRPTDGAIFVIQWRGEVYAKRALVLDDAVYFSADNPAGDHNWLKPKRMDAKRDPITILGRVRWIGSWEG